MAKSTMAFMNKAWLKLKDIPGGKFVYSKLVGIIVPYSGTISARVLEMGQGHAKLKLTNHRKVRNHVHSIHAIALANFGELTTGLALTSLLDTNTKIILVNLNVNYIKIARSSLISEANVSLDPLEPGDHDQIITATIKNAESEIVCEVTATWRLRVQGVKS